MGARLLEIQMFTMWFACLLLLISISLFALRLVAIMMSALLPWLVNPSVLVMVRLKSSTLTTELGR